MGRIVKSSVTAMAIMLCAILVIAAPLNKAHAFPAITFAALAGSDDIMLDVGECTYTGSHVEPDVVVILNGDELIRDIDYSVSFTDYVGREAEVVDVGNYTVVVEGLTFSGTLERDFNVEPRQISDAVASEIPSITYTGRANEPDAHVEFGGATLTEGVDYNVTHVDNENAGTGKVVLEGIGNFTGEATVSYTITPAPIGGATFGKPAAKAYTGKKSAPKVTAKFAGSKLAAGRDYAVSYLNSKKKAIPASKVKAAGTYYAKVTGKGNFTGAKAIKFKIAKAKMSKVKFPKMAKVKYTGKKVKPTLNLKFGGARLKEGKSYKVAYLNSKKKAISASKVKAAGTYFARIVGKGNFQGTKTLKFQVFSKGGKRWVKDYKKVWVAKPVTIVDSKAYDEEVPIWKKVEFWSVNNGRCVFTGDDFTTLYTKIVKTDLNTNTTGNPKKDSLYTVTALDLTKMDPLVLPECLYKAIGHDTPRIDEWAHFLGDAEWRGYDADVMARWLSLDGIYDPGTLKAAIEPLLPEVKAINDTSTFVGNWGTHDGDYAITGYKTVHHGQKTHTVDKGHYKKVLVGGHWA